MAESQPVINCRQHYRKLWLPIDKLKKKIQFCKTSESFMYIHQRTTTHLVTNTYITFANRPGSMQNKITC